MSNHVDGATPLCFLPRMCALGLACLLALLASGCANVAKRTGQGAAMGFAGGIEASKACGPALLICLPFTMVGGAILGGAGGAAFGTVEGAVDKASAARLDASPGSSAGDTSEPPFEGATARHFAALSVRDASAEGEFPDVPPHLQYIGQFESQGGLPHHKFGKMFLDTTSVAGIDPAEGTREPGRTVVFVVNYWSQGAERLQSYSMRAAVDCAALRLRIDRWVEYPSLYALERASAEHRLTPPARIEGDADDPESTVTKGVKAACAARPS